MRTLSAKARQLFDDLPPYYERDPFARGVLDAVGLELARVEEAAEWLRTHVYPHTATDRYRLLGLWERLLELPVENTTLPEAQRSALVLAYFRARKSAKGSEWNSRVTTALQTSNWRYREHSPAPNQVTVTIPYSSTSPIAGLIRTLLRAITPAHVEIIPAYEQGFIVGVSQVGDAI